MNKMFFLQQFGVFMSGSNDLLQNQAIISATPHQIDGVWRNRNGWQLSIKHDGKEIDHELKKKKDMIIIEFDKNFQLKDINKMNFTFNITNRAAADMLAPLMHNGACIKTKSLTVPKSNINIFQKKK